MNKIKPVISVITLSFNLKRFIKETITSVQNQTFKAFEHIVIDAGSTDGTVDILKKFPKIKWISEKDNGYIDGFNKGLKMSKGKFIMSCVVSDGYIDHNWFKRCVAILDTDPEVSLVWGFPQYMDEKGKLGKISYPEFQSVSPPQKQEWIYYWFKKKFWLPEGNFCVRKKVFEECNKYINLQNEDQNYWLEFNYQFNHLGFLPHHIPIVANFGRIHSGQRGENEVHNGVGDKWMKHYLNECERYRWQVLLGLKKHIYRDGAGNILNKKINRRRLLWY